MKKLTAKFRNNYRSAKGNVVFVYTVTGSPANMEAYTEAAGDNLRTDDVSGDVLYFTTNWNGNTISLIITTNGNIVTDTSETDKLVAVVNRSSGILQDKLAGLVAAHMLGNLLGTSAPAATTTAAPVAAPAIEAAPAVPGEELPAAVFATEADLV